MAATHDTGEILVCGLTTPSKYGSSSFYEEYKQQRFLSAKYNIIIVICSPSVANIKKITYVRAFVALYSKDVNQLMFVDVYHFILK